MSLEFAWVSLSFSLAGWLVGSLDSTRQHIMVIEKIGVMMFA